MTASGSYDLQASHRDVTAEIQRLAAQAGSGWDKESRTLSWFGLAADAQSVRRRRQPPQTCSSRGLTTVIQWSEQQIPKAKCLYVCRVSCIVLRPAERPGCFCASRH